ncbi:hypothetical protein PROFUN_14709 [Planoprotostelium fungivorum]|uniref:Uncharacterized protein n=1 Tax=Planoprotostelium fungivorum TaxID=1890364 RepID=A0A2P6MZ50_9EUKA|nr:hypothetical protein PROFUN_14709 [Planoprotostelium fungivorum]
MTDAVSLKIPESLNCENSEVQMELSTTSTYCLQMIILRTVNDIITFASCMRCSTESTLSDACMLRRLYLGRLAMSFILDSHSPTFIALLLSVEEETATQIRADVRRLALCGSPCSVETSRRSTGACTEQRELLVSLTVSAPVSRSPQQ